MGVSIELFNFIIYFLLAVIPIKVILTNYENECILGLNESDVILIIICEKKKKCKLYYVGTLIALFSLSCNPPR